MRLRRVAAALLAVVLVACSGGGDDDDDAAPEPEPEPAVEVRLDQVQMLGSHNSYHLEPAPPVMEPLQQFSRELAESIEYSHPPLSQELDSLGLRHFELDVWADPQGGRFLHRAVPTFLNVSGATGPPDLAEPGFKVFHIQDLDFRSTCLTLFACLAEINEWSDTNPNHVPLLVLIELKDDPIVNPQAEALGIRFTVPKTTDAADLDALDKQIRDVIGDKLLTPDDVRGDRRTLEEAVLDHAWPTIEDARGKLLFALIGGDDVRALYVRDHPSLDGRAMFVDSDPGHPYAAFMNEDNPVGVVRDIQGLVRKGYLVRSRTDGDTREARTNDTRRRTAAFASGAQFVSTDYAVPDPDLSSYRVRMPGGAPVRCNPVTAPPDCTAEALEE